MLNIISNSLIFIVLTFFMTGRPLETKPFSDIPMCNTSTSEFINTGNSLIPVFNSVQASPSFFETDSTKSYTMPTLTQTPSGDVMLTWTEKDEQGNNALCLAFSKDKGKTFSDKKIIHSGAGVVNSRLTRAKVLVKKDGSLLTVFANRSNTEGGKRVFDIMYSVSKDGGDTWSNPLAVDSDPTTGIVRGFFDAVVMSNDEIAVVYLKDVANSKKHEERDLRLVVTKNGVFQPERVIDPVVCDCCNINMLEDATGALNIYYRDNNDDIRDISRLVSSDNAQTFSTPKTVYNDQWKIGGCPHSGAVSSRNGRSALIAWYSGAETEPGIRLVTQEGKKLFVIEEESAKNACLSADKGRTVMLWEQKQADSEHTQIVFRTISGEKISETLSLEGSAKGINSTGLLLGNQLLVAHEVKGEKKNGLKVVAVSL